MSLKKIIQDLPEGGVAGIHVVKQKDKLLLTISSTIKITTTIEELTEALSIESKPDIIGEKQLPDPDPAIHPTPKEVKTKAKTVPAKVAKKDAKGAADDLIKQAAQLFTDRKYVDAKNIFTEALKLEPGNKYIQADIEKCNKWIAAVERLNAEEAPVPTIETNEPTAKSPESKPAPVSNSLDMDFEIPVME